MFTQYFSMPCHLWRVPTTKGDTGFSMSLRMQPLGTHCGARLGNCADTMCTHLCWLAHCTHAPTSALPHAKCSCHACSWTTACSHNLCADIPGALIHLDASAALACLSPSWRTCTAQFVQVTLAEFQ